MADFERCARWLMELPDWPYRVSSSIPDALDALRQFARRSPGAHDLAIDTAFLLGYLRAMPELARALAETRLPPASLRAALEKTAFALAHMSFALAISTIRKARATGENPVELMLRDVALIGRRGRAPRRRGPGRAGPGPGAE